MDFNAAEFLAEEGSFGVFFLVMMVISVGGLVFWIVALVDCVRKSENVYRVAGTEKITWVLIVALTGWIGGLVTMLAFVGPTSVMEVFAFRRWAAWLPPVRQAVIRAALLPVSVGLVASAGVLIPASLGAGPLVVGVVSTVAVLHGTTRLHPLLLLLGGAAIGAATAL